MVDRVPIEVKPHNRNVEYLKIKKEKMGHILTNLDFKEKDAED